MKDNITRETRCTSHFCKRCGMKLNEEWSWQVRLIFIAIWALPAILVLVANNRQIKQMKEISKEPECYRRDYFDWSKTGISEAYEVREFKCPK